MTKRPYSNIGPSIEGRWNGLDTLERLNMILDYRDLFVSFGLVTDQEVEMVLATSEGGREYILEREDQPLFHKINIKKELSTQALRNQLKTALRAVFFDS